MPAITTVPKSCRNIASLQSAAARPGHAAQELGSILRRAARALQAQKPHCAVPAGDRRLCVEHLAGGTLPVGDARGQELYPLFTCHAPRAGTGREAPYAPIDLLRVKAPVHARLGLVDLGGIGDACLGLWLRLQCV